MTKYGSLRTVIFFTALTVALTWVVILGYEVLVRPPFYAWVERTFPGRPTLQQDIQQRVEHFGISTLVDLVVVTLLLRLVNRQQKELIESEGRYRALFEHASDGIGVIRAKDHVIIDVNKKFGDILGYKRLALVSSHVCELFDRERSDSRHNLLSELIACEGAGNRELEAKSDYEEVEMRIINSDGVERIISISSSKLAAGRERLFILIIRDLTEKKQFEQEKQEIERQLFQSSKLASIGELSAGVAHEINNPLNCIVNFAQLLKDDGVARNEVESRMVDGIIDEGERIARIVRDLLTFARQDPREPAEVSMREVIENSMSLFGTQLERSAIAVEIDIPGDLWTVRADAARLRQVVVNMVSNAHQALKTRRSDESLFRIEARNIRRDDRRFVRVEFYDNGPGIAAENIERVFDPFFTTRRDSGGTGLGLSLSFGIIRDYGGTIKAESNPGLFTRFIVELPVNGKWEHRYAESTVGG
jgi:PAS domain S-box-containing protein